MAMLEEMATVVEVGAGGVWVETQPRGGCSQCGSSGCGTSVVAKLFSVKRNRLRLDEDNAGGVVPGQQVVIGIPDGLLVRASVWAYLMPVSAMLLGALGADALGMREGGQSLLALSGLASGFFGVRWAIRRGASRHGYTPRLLRLVGDNRLGVQVPELTKRS